ETMLEDAGWTDDLINKQDDSLKPYEELKNGRVKAVLAESIIARYYVEKNPKFSGDLYNVPAPKHFDFSPGNYAGAVRPGPDDDDLLAAINRALEDMKADGELGGIYNKWDGYGPRQEQLGIMPRKAEETTASESSWTAAFLFLLRGAGLTLLLTVISMPLA